AEVLGPLSRHPLARAMRLDKLSLAALEATLRHYLFGEAMEVVPVWRMLRRQPEDLATQAAFWAERLTAAGVAATVIPGESTVGGGSAPEETLPTSLLALAVPAVEEFARRLRTGRPAIVGRIRREAFLLDPRTVGPQEDELLLERVISAWLGR
ncbi:MAG TPA: L-seryl-tRNA(Sec) selenium transferase, partial [Chloroflexota bacterium]